MDIKNIAEKLCFKCETRNPFTIAEIMGIQLIFEPLGTINGYYQCKYRQKLIHINQDISEQEQKFTCAHELGHIYLHPNINTSFLKTKTLLSVDRLENEANKFAVQLLYDDDCFTNIFNMGIYKIAESLNINPSLVEYKISTLHECITFQ